MCLAQSSKNGGMSHANGLSDPSAKCILLFAKLRIPSIVYSQLPQSILPKAAMLVPQNPIVYSSNEGPRRSTQPIIPRLHNEPLTHTPLVIRPPPPRNPATFTSIGDFTVRVFAPWGNGVQLGGAGGFGVGG